mgnify:CR=1 FL=1
MKKTDFLKMQMDKQFEFYTQAFSYIPKVKEILKRFEGKKITIQPVIHCKIINT